MTQIAERIGNYNVRSLDNGQYSVALNNGNYGACVCNADAVRSLQDKYALGTDTVSFTCNAGPKETAHLEDGEELSLADKQQVIYDATKKASASGMLGMGLMPLYYSLRSDKTIAKKYNLDVDKDKALINDVRKSQTLWSLPAFLPFAGALVAHLIFRSKTPEDMKVTGANKPPQQ